MAARGLCNRLYERGAVDHANVARNGFGGGAGQCALLLWIHLVTCVRACIKNQMNENVDAHHCASDGLNPERLSCD